MRKLLLILALVSFVFAKDNFIHESYAPGKIEKRLAAIEKELRLLRKYVYLNKDGQVVVKKSAVEAKNISSSEIKDLKRSIVSINKELKRLKSAKSTRVDKTLKSKIEVLERKMTKLEKKPVNSSHDSMRIDILDDKISNLEKKLNRLIVNIESDAAKDDGVLGSAKLEYILIGVGVIVLLLLVMVLTAMTRSKEAIRKANKVADVLAKSARRQEEKKQKKEAPKEEQQESMKDVEPVVLKTQETPKADENQKSES